VGVFAEQEKQHQSKGKKAFHEQAPNRWNSCGNEGGRIPPSADFDAWSLALNPPPPQQEVNKELCCSAQDPATPGSKGGSGDGTVWSMQAQEPEPLPRQTAMGFDEPSDTECGRAQGMPKRPTITHSMPSSATLAKLCLESSPWAGTP
jgi:hypothetical protein